MGSSSRRNFLKRLIGVLPTWSVLRRGSPGADHATSLQAGVDPESSRTETLVGLAEIVLPTEALGAGGGGAADAAAERLAATVEEFERWRDGFRPAAELDHPYLWSDELRYGPSDPRPRWSSQLDSLEEEAQGRFQRPYASLGFEERRNLLVGQLPAELPDDLPHAAEAEHIAVAVMAWFFATPRANDLCYRAAIGRHECRGLPEVVNEPSPLAFVLPDGSPDRRPA